MNFTSALARFGTGTYTVTRRAAGSVGTDGVLSPGSPSTFQIAASVQALNGRELQRLSQGVRVAERRKLYTATALQVLDVVAIGTEQWEVEEVADYQDLGSFGKYVVIKVGN